MIQAEGLTDYGVWGCAFTPSTAAFDLEQVAIPAAAARGIAVALTVQITARLRSAFNSGS